MHDNNYIKTSILISLSLSPVNLKLINKTYNVLKDALPDVTDAGGGRRVPLCPSPLPGVTARAGTAGRPRAACGASAGGSADGAASSRRSQ